MRLLNLQLLAWVVLLFDACLAEVAETCSDDTSPVVLLQDRLTLEPYELPQHRAAPRWSNRGGESLQLRLLQAEVAKQREIITQNTYLSHMSQSEGTSLASKHVAGLLIAGVILVILLLFGLCMASSLGLGSEGEAAHKRRLSISDWLIALALGTGLMLLQLYAFYHTGLMAVPAGDFAFPLMVAAGAVTFFSPVLFVSCLHCHSSFEHLDDELGNVTQRFDRLERLVSAGFQKSLQEEQQLLRTLRNASG